MKIMEWWQIAIEHWYHAWHFVAMAPAWRVEYLNGKRSALMRRNLCKDYAEIFGGKVIYCGVDYLLWKYRSGGPHQQ